MSGPYVPPQVTTITETAAQFRILQKAFAEVARVVGENLRRMAQTVIDLRIAALAMEEWEADVDRLKRHLSYCSDPSARMRYIAHETARLGRTLPMLRRK